MKTQELELRKLEEMEFHNKLRDAELKKDPKAFQELTANRKYYAVTRASRAFFESWLIKHCRGKRVLDYGCGDAPFSFLVASHGANVTGIDISDVSVENCRKIALEKGLEHNATFEVMDCEALEFPDNTFDVVFVAGVLHHLDLQRAFTQLARVLKSNGSVIAYEALGHNPIFQLYRLLTPKLRTKHETHHILKIGSLREARKYFDEVRSHFFHLLVLLAVPFRNTFFFKPLFRSLEIIDSIILRIPIIRNLAWMMIFTLAKPKKIMRYLEIRKQEELRHYNEKAQKWIADQSTYKWQTDVHGIRHDIFLSYQFVDTWIKNKAPGKRLLDYGCGTGIHSILPARLGASVVGIDISPESLRIARERAVKEHVQTSTNFIQMDCEQLDFPDSSFDIIFDGGTFSSLDIYHALPELARVLHPDGSIIGIETLGHNPLTNIKRKINKLLGTRTAWAVDHIIKSADLQKMDSYFGHRETYYFHLLGLFLLPLFRIPGVKLLFKFLNRVDTLLLRIPFLQKYAFKAVFILSSPKKILTTVNHDT